MDAILGKISAIEIRGEEAGMWRAAVTVAPACLLPARAAVPRWLADAALTIERLVADTRELGTVGDSFVLSAEESACWLHPLRVEPAVVYGEMPDALRLTLHWWQSSPPPAFTARGPGGEVTGLFQPAEEGYVAAIAVGDLLPTGQARPAEVTVTCGTLSAACALLPDGVFVGWLASMHVHRLQNAWYALDVISHAGGGALADWWERGRALNHFTRPAGLIQAPLEHAGLLDGFAMSERAPGGLAGVSLPAAACWQDDRACSVRLSGAVPGVRGLSTVVTAALATDLPLLRWERAFQFGAAETDRAPHEPIDDIRSFGQSLRAAWLAERAPDSGSRLRYAEHSRIITLRSPEPLYHHPAPGWTLREGWMLVEHPLRRASMLVLSEPGVPIYPDLRITPYAMHLELNWPMAPAFSRSRFSRALAMTAGECGAAVAGGVWVACRIPVGAGVRCALIGRVSGEAALFHLGARQYVAPLRRLALAGVGEVDCAVADCPGAEMNTPLAVEVR